jgi:hypothetical protein
MSCAGQATRLFVETDKNIFLKAKLKYLAFHYLLIVSDSLK